MSKQAANQGKKEPQAPIMAMPHRDKESDLLNLIIDVANDRKHEDQKIMKSAFDFAGKLKTRSTNDISEQELLDYANKKAEKGWLTQFLIANSPKLAKAREDAKSGNKSLTGRAEAKAVMSHAGSVANSLLMLTAYLYTLPESAHAKLTSKGQLQIADENGDPLVLPANAALREARKHFGRTKDRGAVNQEQATNTLSGALTFVTSALAKAKTINDFSPETRDELNLIFDQIVTLMGKQTASELIAQAA